MPFVIALHIKSKFLVLPFMIHPMTINPSYLFITLDNTCGISKDPGTFKNFN